MAIEVSNFGRLADGQMVKKVVIKNVAGTAVSVLTYGATIQALQYRNKDVVLGYDNIEGYCNNSGYLGATVGRVANRTAGGRFTLNGQEYMLNCNEDARGNHLHGGNVGYSHRLWDYTILREGLDPSVRFDLISEDGDEGYPGHLEVSVTFSLNSSNVLELAYSAKSDKDTVVNMTNHTYFNMNGFDGGNVENHQIKLLADKYTPTDDLLIPTGELADVTGTPLDFRTPVTVGDLVNADHSALASAGGIDHNFVLADAKRELTPVAWVYSPETGMRVTCSTDLPGIQVYSGNFLTGAQGKAGTVMDKRQGLCLETQYFPNSANIPAFPSIVLKAGEEYSTVTTYQFERKPIE